MSSYKKYTNCEDALIQELYPFASKEELLNLLPERTWDGIRMRAKKLNVFRSEIHSVKTANIEFIINNNLYLIYKEFFKYLIIARRKVVEYGTKPNVQFMLLTFREVYGRRSILENKEK